MIRRGTTPTLKYILPFNTETIKKIEIVIVQNGKILIKKTNEDCMMESNIISIKLTQKETLLLNDYFEIKMQLRCLLHDDTALASNIISAKAEEILEDGEII